LRGPKSYLSERRATRYFAARNEVAYCLEATTEPSSSRCARCLKSLYQCRTLAAAGARISSMLVCGSEMFDFGFHWTLSNSLHIKSTTPGDCAGGRQSAESLGLQCSRRRLPWGCRIQRWEPALDGLCRESEPERSFWRLRGQDAFRNQSGRHIAGGALLQSDQCRNPSPVEFAL
jgi:hypothetical protein